MSQSIKSYKDLIIYSDTYRLSKCVIQEIIPKLPLLEKYDLKSQLLRSSKAIPRLIAEGYAKKHQQRGFQKYLDDALAEINETMVSLEQCVDFYGKYIDKSLCQDLITQYDKAARQTYKLAQSWRNFKL